MAASNLPGFHLHRARLIGARGEHVRAQPADRDALFFLAVVELHGDDGGRVVVARCRSRRSTKLRRGGSRTRAARLRDCSSRRLCGGRDLLPRIDGVLARALHALERARFLAAGDFETCGVERPEVEDFLPAQVVDRLLAALRRARC